jgi:uncharacterized membrane protein
METQGIAAAILPAHILGGMLALGFGYVALYAAKGATLHRKSGILFVYAMVTMSVSGALIDVLNTAKLSVNVVAGLLTFYFVTTALLTVRRRSQEVSWIDGAAVVLALTVTGLSCKAGLELASHGRPEAIPCFIFAVVGLLAAAGDIRVMREGGVQGPRRIARHLWRMCFAMWVAAASFFWGPPDRVPEVIRIPALQAIAVLLPIVVMLYWLWRVRVRHAFGRLVITAPQISVPAAPDAATFRA